MYHNLKLRLWRTGIKQNRLAHMVLLDESMLSKIINGFRRPSQDLRERIAKALDSDPDWLFEEIDDARDSNPGEASRSRL